MVYWCGLATFALPAKPVQVQTCSDRCKSARKRQKQAENKELRQQPAAE